MPRLLPALLLLALTVYCVVNIAQSPSGAVRNLPRWGWLLLVLFFPLAGGIAYLLAGRPLASAPGGLGPGRGGRRQAPRGPDDDEDFLRKL